MVSSHSPYSPSKAHRYIRCPGSVALEAGLEDSSSTYAREGTAAHKLAEMVLKKEIVLAEEMIGRSINWQENGEKATLTPALDHGEKQVQKQLKQFLKLKIQAKVRTARKDEHPPFLHD